ncbi:MAG: Gfo/Idh/MocA family oxidoreductase [Alphaproteobacteria bacterium]|nr:Gfo/Idh/MocA family oxidoreductase [Alphaproteobacteria bacterium]
MKIGWIGCGRHAGEMLLPQLTRYPVTLAALCDVDAAKLAQIGHRYGVPESRRFATAEAMLAAGGLDGVGMAVGPDQHRDFAIAALARGLPVFMEKPPGRNGHDARAIADAAKRAGRPVIVGFMKRFSTANRVAINLARGFGCRASFLGQYMTAPTYFVGDPDYTGFYLHHCVHYLDLVPHLMGRPVRLHARKHLIAPGKLMLHLDFAFAGGELGTLVMGTNQSRATPMEWWQVMGDHERVEVRNVHEVRLYRASSFKVDDPAATLADGSDAMVWEPNLTVAANEDHKGYHALLGCWLDVLAGKPREDAPTIADGIAAMDVLDAMVRSIEAGRAMAV